MELVLPFVDAAVAGHEGADFLLPFLDSLRQFPAHLGHPAFRKVGAHLGVDEQYLLGGISHNTII